MSTFVARLLIGGHNLEERDRLLEGPVPNLVPDIEAWLLSQDEASRDGVREQRAGYLALISRLPAEGPDVYRQIGNMSDEQLRKLAVGSGYGPMGSSGLRGHTGTAVYKGAVAQAQGRNSALSVSAQVGSLGWASEGGVHWCADPTHYITNPALAIREPTEVNNSVATGACYR